MPQSMPVDGFESKVLRLSLTGTTVTPDNLHNFHPMKNKEKVIIKFNKRKHKNKIIFSWKELK